MNFATLVQFARTDKINFEHVLNVDDESQLVEALRSIPSEISSENRQDAVKAVERALRETTSHRVRNAAALSLTDMLGKGAADVILDIVARPELARSSGTLLFALNDIGADIPLGLIVNLIETGSLEAKTEALTFMEEGRVDPFSSEDENAAKERLNNLLIGSNNPDLAEAARIAIEILQDYKPELALAPGM